MAAEPQPALVVLDVEHDEAAERVRESLHGDGDPFALRLVLVLLAQLGTDFIGAQLQTELLRLRADLVVACALLEAKLGDGEDNEVYILLLARDRDLAEDVFGPGPDLESFVDEGLLESGGVLVGAELQGLPRRELGGLRGRRCGRIEAQKELLQALWVIDPSLHHVVRELGEVLGDPSDQPS